MSEPAISRELGISYRRLDYWVRRGYLRCAGSGTGHDRDWAPGERRIAVLMARLADAGLTPAAAHRVARSGGTCELAPGIRVSVDGASP